MDENQNKANSYTIDNLPEDVEVFSQQAKQFDPIDPTETYTVELVKAELVDNRYYDPDATDPLKRGQKYQLNLEYRVLDEGEFYGRRLWDYANLVFKPDGKRGASKLYKIVTCALNVEFDWDECASFASDIKVFITNLEKQVIGKQIKVAIENVKKDNGSVRTKITTYNRVKKQLPEFDSQKVGKSGDEKIEPDEIELPL